MAGAIITVSADTRVVDRGMDKIVAGLEQEAGAVYVGILQEEDGKGKLATIATALEFGALAGKGHKTVIPARPYMRGAISKGNERIMRLGKRLHKQIMAGTMSKAQGLDTMGAFLSSLIKNEIVDLKEPPNAPATLKKKAPKTNPLVDKGILGAAINWVVRRE